MRIECADKKSAKQHFCYSVLFPHCPSGYGDIVFYCLINENRRLSGILSVVLAQGFSLHCKNLALTMSLCAHSDMDTHSFCLNFIKNG